jgi:hypothetical protein
MRIRRMREVLHIVDDSMLEAFTAGQAAALPPVHAIPERRVQVQNVHFCVLHGWTAVVPLPVVECGLPTASPSPPALVFDAGSSASAPMDVDLAAPPPPPPTAASVVVGTIAARRGQPPRAVSTSACGRRYHRCTSWTTPSRRRCSTWPRHLHWPSPKWGGPISLLQWEGLMALDPTGGGYRRNGRMGEGGGGGATTRTRARSSHCAAADRSLRRRGPHDGSDQAHGACRRPAHRRLGAVLNRAQPRARPVTGRPARSPRWRSPAWGATAASPPRPGALPWRLEDASLAVTSHRARRDMSRGRKPALPGGRIWRRSPTARSHGPARLCSTHTPGAWRGSADPPGKGEARRRRGSHRAQATRDSAWERPARGGGGGGPPRPTRGGGFLLEPRARRNGSLLEPDGGWELDAPWRRLANAPGGDGGYRGRLGLEILAAPI